MRTFLSWLLHPVTTDESSGEAHPNPGPLKEEEAGPEQREASLTTEGGTGTGLTQPSGGLLFMGFEVLVHRQDALLDALTPVRENAALLSFVGMGITHPSHYQDAAAAFSQFRLMAPARQRARMYVFSQQLREESEGSDFLYIHFAGAPTSFGFLICALSGGGLMAGWRLS